MRARTLQALQDAVTKAVASQVAPGVGPVVVATCCQVRDQVVYPLRWRVRTRLPERFGMPCRVLVRGRRNNALVEFSDGYRVVTSRNYVRKTANGDRRQA